MVSNTGEPNGEDLAIAVQTRRRDEAFNVDWPFFRDNPDRSYRTRLATPQEIADLQSSGAWPPGWTIDPACFIWAIVRGSRTGLETIYLVLRLRRRSQGRPSFDACGAGRRRRLGEGRGSEQRK